MDSLELSHSPPILTYPHTDLQRFNGVSVNRSSEWANSGEFLRLLVLHGSVYLFRSRGIKIMPRARQYERRVDGVLGKVDVVVGFAGLEWARMPVSIPVNSIVNVSETNSIVNFAANYSE